MLIQATHAPYSTFSESLCSQGCDQQAQGADKSLLVG